MCHDLNYFSFLGSDEADGEYTIKDPQSQPVKLVQMNGKCEIFRKDSKTWVLVNGDETLYQSKDWREDFPPFSQTMWKTKAGKGTVQLFTGEKPKKVEIKTEAKVSKGSPMEELVRLIKKGRKRQVAREEYTEVIQRMEKDGMKFVDKVFEPTKKSVRRI